MRKAERSKVLHRNLGRNELQSAAKELIGWFCSMHVLTVYAFSSLPFNAAHRDRWPAFSTSAPNWPPVLFSIEGIFA